MSRSLNCYRLGCDPACCHLAAPGKGSRSGPWQADLQNDLISIDKRRARPPRSHSARPQSRHLIGAFTAEGGVAGRGCIKSTSGCVSAVFSLANR